MNAATILRAFKPNTTLFGYASFLAVNATGAWGGFFPFLPMKLQEPPILLWFFLVQSLVFAGCFFLSVAGAYRFPGPTRLFIVRLSAIPYLLGWFCLIGSMYFDQWVLPLVIAGGGFIGIGSAGFYMLWQRLFASLDSDAGNHNLILGTAYASLLYFALHLVPHAITVYLIPLVITPFFALAISLKSREIDFNQPMFEDIPKKNKGVYRRAISNLARPALCVGSLGLCAGLIRALAIDDPSIGSLVNVLSMGASLVTAVVFLVLWQFKSVRLNVVSLFRVVFPVIITSFVLLPFLGNAYAQWLAAILYAAYSVAIMLMMIQCAQSSRDHGTNPVFVYGFFGGIVYILHDAGFIGGTIAGQVAVPGLTSYAIVAIGAGYILGFMYFFGQGGFQNAVRNSAPLVPDVELVSLAPAGSAIPGGTSDATRVKSGPRNESARMLHPAQSTKANEEPFYHDRVSKQVAAIRQEYRLSAREAEVMEHIVRGKTVVRIAEELVISENTVRMHSKRIYAKLNVHKKQELIDLVDSLDPKSGS
ncbi:helix-turn-helix transcriptional regulator [Gordonibacter sp.]|uniref:helix-turn-helix transcriptional regulator n=2 Tax=Gordonibacter sp. TaxID=1968902 RepID=UPI002FC94EAB